MTILFFCNLGDRGELQLTGSLQEEESKASTSEDIEDGDHGDSQGKSCKYNVVFVVAAFPTGHTTLLRR